MLRKFAILCAVALSGVVVAGCASDTGARPYSLTGQTTQDRRYIDQKGHDRPDLAPSLYGSSMR